MRKSTSSRSQPDEMALKTKYFEKASEWLNAEAAFKELVEKGTLDEDDDFDEDDVDDEDDDTADDDAKSSKVEAKSSKTDDDDADPPKKRAKTSATTVTTTKTQVLDSVQGLAACRARRTRCHCSLAPLGATHSICQSNSRPLYVGSCRVSPWRRHPMATVPTCSGSAPACPRTLSNGRTTRLEMMKMKGEIERLKFQLRQSEGTGILVGRVLYDLVST